MAEELNGPNMGYIDVGNLRDTPYESNEDNEHPDNGSDISPGQSPRGAPVSFVFPPTRRLKILSGIFEGPEGNLPYHSQTHSPYENASSPTLRAHRNCTVNEEEDESNFEDDSESEEEEEPRAPRLVQGKANTHTFDAPTKSSMAKQNEKVEFPPTVRRTSTMNIIPSARLDPVRRQRSLFSEGRASHIHLGNSSSVDAPRPNYPQTLNGRRDDDVEIPSVLVSSTGQSSHRIQRSRSLDPYHRSENMHRRASLAGFEHPQIHGDLDDSQSYSGWKDPPQDLLIPEVPPVDSHHDARHKGSTPEQRTFESLTSSFNTAASNKAIHTIAAANRPREVNINVREYVDEYYVVGLREQLEALRDQVEIAQLQRRTAQQELRAVQNEHGIIQHDLNAVRDKYGQLEEHLRAVQGERNEPLSEPQISLEHHEQLQQENEGLLHDLQGLKQRIRTCHLQKQVPDSFEAALEEIALLRVAGLDVKKAEKDSENANAEAGQIYDELMKLQDEVRFLELCVKEKFTTVIDGATESGLVRSKIQWEGSAPVVKDHAASLLQLFDAFDHAIGTLAEKNNELQKKLLEEERLSKYLDEKKSTDSQSSLTFQKLYEDELKKRKTLEANFQKFRDVAAGSMDRDLRIENAKLKDGLDKYHRRTIIPRLQAGFYQASARIWQEEARTAKAELNKRIVAFQDECAAQTTEMLLYIRDYYDKTKDASHWNLQDLQTKVATLERDLRQTSDLFSETKSEKARLEDKFAKLRVEIAEKEKFIKERLMYGADYLPAPSPVPKLDLDNASTDTSRSSSPISWLATPRFCRSMPRYPPRFLLKQEECKATIIHFRQEQEKRRSEEEDALDEIMEKLRRYRMGVMGVKYPPSKGSGWEAVEKKSLWDRWDGEGWRREVQLTMPEERLIRGLKEKRVLVTEEKPRLL